MNQHSELFGNLFCGKKCQAKADLIQAQADALSQPDTETSNTAVFIWMGVILMLVIIGGIFAKRMMK